MSLAEIITSGKYSLLHSLSHFFNSRHEWNKGMQSQNRKKILMCQVVAFGKVLTSACLIHHQAYGAGKG